MPSLVMAFYVFVLDSDNPFLLENNSVPFSSVLVVGECFL